MTIKVSNEAARRIFMARQGLSSPPGKALSKDGLLQLITDLGFVQVDSIGTVERAHHQIIFSRNQTYRRNHLTTLLEKDRALFEHRKARRRMHPGDEAEMALVEANRRVDVRDDVANADLVHERLHLRRVQGCSDHRPMADTEPHA